jgi:two-component system NtrC family sensor kinase
MTETTQKTINVLVVEDDLVDRTQLERLLNRSTLPAKIITAGYLDGAIQLLKNTEVDVILLDLHLPDSTGLETLITLTKKHPKVSIIVTTGEGGDGLGLKAVACGAQDYLIKGEFDTQTLTKSILYSIERKRMSATLQETEDRYRRLHESMQDGFAQVDMSGNIVSVNPPLLKMLGYLEQELLKLKFTNITPSKWTDYENNIIQKQILVRGYSDAYEKEYIRKDGSVFPVELKTYLLRDKNGKPEGMWAVIRDITDRKKAEEVLRSERNKAKKYLDVAGVLMLVLDNGETVHRINKKGCEILGYTEEEILGKNWCDYFVPPDQKEDVRTVLKGMMCGEVNQYEYHENPVLTKSGEKRLIAWHNVSLWDEAKKINAVLSSGDDITERRAAEIELLNAYKELEKVHTEMKGMQSQIVQSEKLASVGQLAAGVAHEMNTPVGFVVSNFETLQKYFRKFKTLLEMYAELGRMMLTADKSQLSSKLAEINKTATDMKVGFVLEDIGALFEESKEGLTRVTKIIQNLRDFSRIDQAEAFDEYDINHGIEATLVVAKNAVKHHADVITEFADVPQIPCNASPVNQVFLNILVNAAQAIESQHRETNGSIKIKTYTDDIHVICRIIDDGPGIPANIIEKIFDPFFTTKPAGKGTGLGLSVSYDIIVRKHKGELLVSSEVGKGTEFTIKLPIKPTPTGCKCDKETKDDAIINSPICR